MRVGRRIAFEDLVRFDGERRRSVLGLIAGVDEAGRGALAGPVVAAAVICEPLRASCAACGIRSSCPRGERERLYARILERCVAHGVGIVEAGEIDRINILRATLKAMKIAVESLGATPDLVLVDGNRLPDIGVPAMAITGRRREELRRSPRPRSSRRSRGTASCVSAPDVFRGYGFRQNKGYGTSAAYRGDQETGPDGVPPEELQGRRVSIGACAGFGGGGGGGGGNVFLGTLGERIAALYLQLAGCAILERNFRFEHVEIDLIVRDGPCVAFVEVKTRRGAPPSARRSRR